MAPDRLLKAGAACSALAGLIHVVNAPEHLAEWWGYGLFFLLASVAQLWFAVGLLVTWHARYGGGDEGTRSFVAFGLSARAWYALGITGNAAIVALYVVTRTAGIPLLGPDAGAVEPVTPLGVASKLFELALIGVLVVLSRSEAPPAPPSGSAPRSTR